MLSPLYRSLAVLSLLLIRFDLSSQSTINRFKDKERHGFWIDHWDDDGIHVANTGRYRKGIPKGTWRYYDREGRLEKKERIILNRLYTTFYYPSGLKGAEGQVRKKGKAKVLYKDTIHYYYSGKWKTYAKDGELLKVQVYKKGKQISERICHRKETGASNDSLHKVIHVLNERFEACSSSMLKTGETFLKGSPEYNQAVTVLNQEANDIYREIGQIIEKFGYPGRTLMGDDYALVFSLISKGNLTIKERYYEDIIQAADKGELDWADVAFFVDKVLVAKKMKQRFGTQYTLDQYTQLFYPIENISGLNERRKKAGLGPLDITTINDSAPY